MTSLIWQDLRQNQLIAKQLYDVLQLRSAVFIDGQQLIYQDIDNKDLTGDNRHVMAWKGDQLIAYARILVENDTLISIGRVCVAPSARGTGLGFELMQRAIGSCEHYNQLATIKVSAQLHVKDFYSKLGFIPKGDIYYEAGIAHIKMLKTTHNQ